MSWLVEMVGQAASTSEDMNKRKKNGQSKLERQLWYLIALLMGAAFVYMMFKAPKVEARIKASLVDPSSNAVFVIIPPVETVDFWVDKYAKLYSKTDYQYKHNKVLLHCLLLRESSYGDNKGHGDNGKAGGPLQFHNPTWNDFRKLMGKQQGSRYDMEQAIETTAWSLSTGRGHNWGPILRGECK